MTVSASNELDNREDSASQPAPSTAAASDRPSTPPLIHTQPEQQDHSAGVADTATTPVAAAAVGNALTPQAASPSISTNSSGSPERQQAQQGAGADESEPDEDDSNKVRSA
ncbi:MAG TPA: hypothetical protein V6C97_34410 [Oculatellaceae cyanobacterium]